MALSTGQGEDEVMSTINITPFTGTSATPVPVVYDPNHTVAFYDSHADDYANESFQAAMASSLRRPPSKSRPSS